MKKQLFSVFALSFALAACGGGESEDTDVLVSDTTAIMGQDTIQQPTVVPVTDSVVTTTTVDTMQTDATVADTAQQP